MDRYTSPETSRALAAAGLEQDAPEGAWWCEAGCSVVAPHVVVSRRASGEGPRALALTDILHELTRPRPEEADARPLCTEYVLEYENGEHCCSGSNSPHAAVMGGTSEAEAAAACLLALLRERKKDVQPEETTDGSGSHEAGPRW